MRAFVLLEPCYPSIVDEVFGLKGVNIGEVDTTQGTFFKDLDLFDPVELAMTLG